MHVLGVDLSTGCIKRIAEHINIRSMEPSEQLERERESGRREGCGGRVSQGKRRKAHRFDFNISRLAGSVLCYKNKLDSCVGSITITNSW